MAKSYKFNNTKDVDFDWVEELYKDSYKEAKCKVVKIIRTKSKGKPWRDITTEDSAAKSVVKMANEGFDEVRMVIRTDKNSHTYMNIPIRELHKDFKYPKPKV